MARWTLITFPTRPMTALKYQTSHLVMEKDENSLQEHQSIGVLTKTYGLPEETFLLWENARPSNVYKVGDSSF